MHDDDPPFSLQRSRDGDTAVVAPHGEIDLSNVDRIRDAAVAASRDATTVVFDLREVGFVDSSGVRLLVELQRAADQDGVAFYVVRGPEHVQRLFDLAGLTGRLALIDDPAEAAGRGGDGEG